jgi:hypothetical protein
MEPLKQGLNIVFRGNFNPAIFHPSWFASHGLIRSQEVDAAKVQIVHPDAAVFTAEWLEINVVRDRFQAATVQESYYEVLRDLVIGVLNLLSHTPLRVMGLNCEFHYQLRSEDAWHSVGHRLVPKADWKDLLEKPGMKSLIVEGVRPDDLKGYIRVKVEPSTRVSYGVYVEVNDHYDLRQSDDTISGASEAMRILSERWSDSMKRSVSIAQKIASLGSEDLG